MTDKEFKKAAADFSAMVENFNKVMEGRTARVVKRMFELFDTKEEAAAELLSMGYTKDDIRESGYDA